MPSPEVSVLKSESMPVAAVARSAHDESWPSRVSLLCLGVGLLALVLATGCSTGHAASDAHGDFATSNGTISGTVRVPGGAAPADRRVVEVVNVVTNERRRVRTDAVGGFTVRVKPGKYRVVVALRNGESLVKGPGVMDVARGTSDARADFVIGTVHVSRPRTPAYRGDDGLGSPIA
jgi:hypothetical protein